MSDDRSGIQQSIGLPPTETVEFFRQKGFAQQAEWDELWQADHGRAFTVTKIFNADLLRQVRASLDKMLAEGGTFEMWKADILPRMQAAGWWGRVEDKALTGVDRPVWVGERRLRTIYDTNLRMARAAGAWTRIQALKGVAPYLKYDANDDGRTRPLHRKWGGLDNGKPVILPVDHPWWQTHFPPCGWNCRCTTLQLSERDLRDNGWKVSEPPDDGPPKRFLRSTGEIVEVPRGIDPGFAYNPGSAYLHSSADAAADTLEKLAAINLPAAQATVADLVASTAFEAFMKESGVAFPVMVLGPEVRAAIGASSAVARLSSAAVRPDITIDDYRRLPSFAQPSMVFSVEDGHVMLVQEGGEDGQWLRVGIITDIGGAANQVVNLELADAKDIARLNQRGRLVFGELAPWLLALLLTEEFIDLAGDAEPEA